jgi:hypothetical protein
MRLRNLCINNVNYCWSVKRSDKGNLLKIESPHADPKVIFVKDRNITPKVVTKLIRRYIK